MFNVIIYMPTTNLINVAEVYFVFVLFILFPLHVYNIVGFPTALMHY